SLLPPPPRSTLFPYTTLFRSGDHRRRLLPPRRGGAAHPGRGAALHRAVPDLDRFADRPGTPARADSDQLPGPAGLGGLRVGANLDRKSTRLNSSHVAISYAVF